MDTLEYRNLEIKTARNGEKIPVVNGVHLHSSYNPTKEASAFVAKHEATLRNKNEVLVLGLAYAYHINEITQILQEAHGDNFKVMVIEPNELLYKLCIQDHLLIQKNVTVYIGNEAEKYYQQKELINFLIRRPTVIAHPASFNLYQDFFKSFLAYESPRTLDKMVAQIEQKEVKEYLAGFPNESTLDQVAKAAFTQNSNLSELDFLLLALKEMTSKNENKASGVN